MRTELAQAYASAFLMLAAPFYPAQAEMPAGIDAPDQSLVTTIHAVGAQISECKADAAGRLFWQFREPVATLFVDGKTVGRHYAGPNWELTDGSAVVGKVSGRAPAASAHDIPLLRLDVAQRRGAGELSGITTIQRINTRGGVAEGGCERAGAYLSVPYTADYTFFRKRG
jgi:hypothetical protein